ncbi:hypothetical protein DKG77_12405 [Flagellimonas aquimarina]|jgi:ABC-2 type transport system permease protein|uniref:DUF3526 domain-containing protein n=1 Tax=Flagellimonas aquimarina TaxID=2201895 RepID=A0A316KZK6_9FLAO|nr:DUF3526 domain-containing protein [Allomuricauda koreensis]PWL39021.1 hypothetical protein DKG77_12405 [Allomuricauda koreensis]
MYKYNFVYELKVLVRNGWIQLLSLLLLGLFCFAAFNGSEKVEKRKLDIQAAKTEVRESDHDMLMLLDSVEQGMEVSASRWTIPTSPTAVGNYHPRVADMSPKPLAFIAMGQSDLFTHYVKPTMTGDDFTLNFTEITNPVQQLFGSFDLSFVIVYLLPLIIIAFSYNVLSAERESGSLKLLASQPISLRNWVLQKISLRFFWVALLTIVILTLVMMFFGTNTNLKDWFSILGITIAYMLFWFTMAFLVNLQTGSSSKNAIILLGLWVVFVLLVPSVLNQLGSTLYPMPSRTLMINEMRNLKAQTVKRQDEILDNFLRDHPEYAINDPNQNRKFYHRYVAAQKLVKEELKPIINKFEQQLQKQQAWISQLRWISPAIVTQQSLSTNAGTSTADYENYRGQVIQFAEAWRTHLVPFLYNNQSFTSKDYDHLPVFTYQPLKSNDSSLSWLVLLVISIVLGATSIGLSSKSKSSSTLAT